MLAVMALISAPIEAQPGQVSLIVPGVWFREGDLAGAGHSNNIIIEMKDYLIVVDANYPSGAKMVLEIAQRISSKPVKYVFNTHFHGDHIYGNSIWTQAGAITLASSGTVEELKKYEPGRWKQSVKDRPDVAALHLNGPELPQQTFEKSPFILKDSTREVRFYSFGWAHTRGDSFVYLPKEKVLCTGDAVVNGPYNNLTDANLGNWPKVIRSIQALNPEYVLPGHGESGGPEIIDGQIRFLNELRKAVEGAIKSGKKLTEVVPAATTTVNGAVVPADTSLTLPASVKAWVGPLLPAQVRDMWQEIVEKTPHGDLPHN
jgi:glyoxylase-like metal-dependent hydrolase (beta-lactamase superfamily II)